MVVPVIRDLGIFTAASLGAVGVALTYYWAMCYWSLHRFTEGYTKEEGQARLEKYKVRWQDGRPTYRIVNLDGAVLSQRELISQMDRMEVLQLESKEECLRLECSYSRWYEFERELTAQIGTSTDDELANCGPIVSFLGSNDYHHLSLALIRRFRMPFNVIILDNHPDWIKYYLGLHCGSWLNHVAELDTVQHIFHMGGNSGEFEDTDLLFLTPWEHLVGENAKIKVMPAIDYFEGQMWSRVDQDVVRKPWYRDLTRRRVVNLFKPYREYLSQYPCYITLDKDVMTTEDAVQNWNSGVLSLKEVILILEVLIELSAGRLLALDVVGDFTKMVPRSLYRCYLHRSQHEESLNEAGADAAMEVNQRTNLALLRLIERTFGEIRTQ